MFMNIIDVAISNICEHGSFERQRLFTMLTTQKDVSAATWWQARKFQTESKDLPAVCLYVDSLPVGDSMTTNGSSTAIIVT